MRSRSDRLENGIGCCNGVVGRNVDSAIRRYIHQETVGQGEVAVGGVIPFSAAQSATLVHGHIAANSGEIVTTEAVAYIVKEDVVYFCDVGNAFGGYNFTAIGRNDRG